MISVGSSIPSGSQLAITLGLGDPKPSSGRSLHFTWCTDINAGKSHILPLPHPPPLPLSPPTLKKEKQRNPTNQAVSVEACSLEEKHGEQCVYAFLNTNRPPWGEAGLDFCVMTPISSPGGEAAAFNCPQTQVRLLPEL